MESSVEGAVLTIADQAQELERKRTASVDLDKPDDQIEMKSPRSVTEEVRKMKKDATTNNLDKSDCMLESQGNFM